MDMFALFDPASSEPHRLPGVIDYRVDTESHLLEVDSACSLLSSVQRENEVRTASKQSR
jgi:hypothetical protein